MFHFRYELFGVATLNAILPTASAQQAPELNLRDVDLLQELADLGMQLARLAAQEARQHQAQQEPEPARPRRADPLLIFLRLSHAICQTIILKTRLATGILPPPPRASKTRTADLEAPQKPEDPRRPLILRYFREGIDLTRQKSKIATSLQIVEDHIDAELAKDPQHRLPGRTILRNICRSLDLPFYASRMHSDLNRSRGNARAA